MTGPMTTPRRRAGGGAGHDPANEARQIVRAIIGCFLASGAVGLIYEILWIRMLGLVFGHTVFAVTTVLASFMAGLGLGSLVFGRIADGARSPLRLYGLLEIGIGVYCLALPLFLDGAAGLYLWTSRTLTLPYLAFSLIQFGLVALLLVPPTFLMGATLPVLARFFVREEGALGRQIGLLYAANTWGAVAGTLLAGYFLVPSLGIQTTLQMGVVANLGLGTLVLVFDRHLRRLTGGIAAVASAMPEAPEAPGDMPEQLSTLARVLVAAGFLLSGAASMVYEVTWTRALTLSIGSSTYAFTAMLAAFLSGIAGGSWAFALLVGRRRLGPEAFAVLQIAIGLSGLALVPAFERMPLWFLTAFQYSQAPGYIQGVQFALSVAVMLGPTLLIGATFPCAVRILTLGLGRVGYDTGWIYALNTAGAILGSSAAGFLLVPTLGIQTTMRIGIAINLAVGIAILLSGGRTRARALRGLGLAAATAAAIALVLLPPWNPALMSSGVAIYGRQYLPLFRLGEFRDPTWQPRILFYRDGISATVTVHQDGTRRFLRTNGKTDAGTGNDMHTQLLLGHLPMLLHPNPRRVLVIGLGSGITAGAVAQYPAERIDIIEIEPAVVEAARFFETENRKVLSDPRVRLIVADGRNFLLNARTPYDVIISEPSNPWIRGLATLFTREFFALARSRLAPEGLMLQWLQSYSLAPEDLRMVAGTFRTAFPQASLWNTTPSDNLLLGGHHPFRMPLGRIRDRFAASAALREDFTRIGLSDPGGLLANLLLLPDDLARFAGKGPLNTDDTLWLEYSAPRSLYQPETADTNYAILRSFKSFDLPPLAEADRRQAESAGGRHALGVAYLAKSLPAEAEAQFALALRADPGRTDSRLEEARLLAQRGLQVQALRRLEGILARDSRIPQAQFQLGQLYQQQGLPEPALAAFERAAALAPENREFRLRLAALLRLQGNLARARAECQRLIAQRPEDPDPHLALAEILLTEGNLAGATRILQSLLGALSVHPVATQASIRHLAGVALGRAGRLPQGIAELEAAVRLSPSNADYRLAVSLAYETQGDLARAAATLERLLILRPNHPQALLRLERLERRLEEQAS